MQARKMAVSVWSVSNLHGEKNRFGLEGSATRVIKVFPPPPRPGGEILSGDAKSQAETLVRKLKERHMI
jgi:electron transfer flavoprotein beta subunit